MITREGPVDRAQSGQTISGNRVARPLSARLNDRMRYGDLSYGDIRQLSKEDDVVAVLPLGCTEQQGPHLPVDFDTWFAEALMVAAADAVQRTHDRSVLVLPAIPVGPTPEHRSFGAGYLDLPAELHDKIVTAIATSIIDQGFRRIVIWRGCGQHDQRQTVADLSQGYPSVRTLLPDQPFNDIWCTIGDASVPGGHADSFTTAIALARRPDAVRTDRIPGPSRTPDWEDPDLDFGRYSDSGVIGDPRHATAELGHQLWDASVSWAAEYLAAI